MINGNMIGNGAAPLKTVIIEDADGNEMVGVVTGSEVIFTATDNDVRSGSVYASDGGISTGTKDIPIYYARCGRKFVLAGQTATLAVPEYDYTHLMIIISTYDTSVDQSVSPTYISVDDGVYAVGNNTKLANITVDSDNEQINFGITVDQKSVLRYFVMKEEY